MISDPESNFFLVVMSQKMSFRYGSKVTFRLVRQTYMDETCSEVSLIPPTSLPQEWFN
ncbi:hypothetical protein Lalb_Chr07g0194611 [Lupinus albus]|uniref:Uncharacterized protein n=1 Tax=Lupinus albus TaxID=3870 RepID=A0A6A4QC39_LUPAL|nr:hypothetical protein Lalb_Chr07g0194611 [Lupinus albus]